MRDNPCHGCTERFTACWGKCPKDARGEYGYDAWKADFKAEDDADRERKHRDREDFLRSEECTWKNKRRSVPR